MTNEEANKVIKSFDRYILRVASRFNQPEYLQDLIQIGRMAALDASTKYDSSKGTIIAYTTTYIKYQMMNFLTENVRTIRIPNNKVTQVSIPTISLNTPINDDGDTVEDLIPSIDSDIYPEQNEALKSLYLALSQLKPQYQLIVRMYFDLDDNNKPMTLQAIGDKLGISKEAVRQQLEKAIKKLKEKML